MKNRSLFKWLSRVWLYMFCLTMIGSGISQSVSADNYVPTLNESHRITAPGVWDFGEAVAIDGDTLLSTSRIVNEEVNEVYVFVRSGNTWTQQAVLTPDTGDFFISKLALDGNTALVMGRNNDGARPYDAAIYVFVRSGTTWSLEAKLTPDDGPKGAFGYSLALQGDTALIFSLDEGPNYTTRVAVYAFERSGSTWTQQQKITAGDYLPDGFGHVALDGDVAVVGVLHGYDDTGEAYVYQHIGGNWVEQQILTPAGGAGNWFGYSTAIEGNNILVGDYALQVVYTFKYNGSIWTEQQQLTSPDPSLYGGYGNAISMDGNGAIVGTYSSGRAFTYLYDGTTWHLQNRLLRGAPGYTVERWGFAIGLSGTTAVVGAQYNDTLTYVFDNAVTANVDDNLLVNGSFEINLDNNNIPDGWSRKKTTDDKQSCNQVNQPPVAYHGDCAYLLKGGSDTNRRLVQNVNLYQHILGAGDRIKLNGFYNKQSTGNVVISIYVSYNNLPEDQVQVTVTRSTSGYQALPAAAITLRDTPTRVRVTIHNNTTTGNTYIDDLRLKVTGSSNSTPLVPLPGAAPLEVPQTQLQGRQ